MKKNSATIAFIFLGALLVATGAYLAYTMMKPKPPMNLVMPKDEDAPLDTSKADLTLLLIQKDEVYYYKQDMLYSGKIIALKDVGTVLTDQKKAGLEPDGEDQTNNLYILQKYR